MVILIISCEYPSYLIDFDRDHSTPKDISLMMIDAFTIQIEFTVTEEKKIDSAVVYRALSPEYTTRIDTLIFSSIGNAVGNNSDTLLMIDTAATYGYWNYYTVLSWSKGVSSLLSDTVSDYFQIPSPNCVIELTETGIRQSVSHSQYFSSGVKILRESIMDTSIQEFVITNDDTQIFQDSLFINYNMPNQNYSTASVYYHGDIAPNISYTYAIQTFQEKNGEVRYSSNFAETITFNAITPDISSKAISDSLIRIYLANTDTILYDSFYVFGYSNFIWDMKKKGKLVELIHYQQNSFIHVNQTQPIHYKILTKNEHYYTISDSILVTPLAIPGFRLIEGGNFLWGCNDNDTQCDSIEYPVQNISINDYYMSIYEVTESAYTDVTNWPPIKYDLPAENISFIDALNYCNNMRSTFSQYDFFIPSEQEWEYAAKYNIASQTGTIYPWANDIDIFNANYGYQNPGSVGVGTYLYKSHFGMYDMAGNVLEWTNNCFTETLQDSVVDNDDCWVVARGGGFWHGADGIRTTSRYNLPQNTETVGVGLRIAMRPN